MNFWIFWTLAFSVILLLITVYKQTVLKKSRATLQELDEFCNINGPVSLAAKMLRHYIHILDVNYLSDLNLDQRICSPGEDLSKSMTPSIEMSCSSNLGVISSKILYGDKISIIVSKKNNKNGKIEILKSISIDSETEKILQ